MILNNLEFFLMNNPLRRLIQEYIEIKRLRNLSNFPSNKTVLEIGCGNGSGAKLIRKYFLTKNIYATDLDPQMIKIAKNKNEDNTINFSVGNATRLKFKDNFFDAVFDFGVIHHITNWKKSLDEIKRVLKPKGQFICEDLSIETFQSGIGRVFKPILTHPYAVMYKEKEFVNYLKKIGLKILVHKRYNTIGIRYFVIITQK